MRDLQLILLFVILLITFTGCSWAVNLVIANKSKENAVVEYTLNLEDNQLFDSPKTYYFNSDVAHLNKQNLRLKKQPTAKNNTNDSTTISVTLKPGQALYIGRYYSFQNRDEFLEKHRLTLKLGLSKTDGFKHWKNINTDLLEIH